MNKNVDEIVAAVGKKFPTFGGGKANKWNPVSIALAEKPLSFAACVDVKEVVEFVIDAYNAKLVEALRQLADKNAREDCKHEDVLLKIPSE
jgi:hypothetical protein